MGRGACVRVPGQYWLLCYTPPTKRPHIHCSPFVLVLLCPNPSCVDHTQACADRYTAFRAYVLSLKDSSSNLSLQQAAVEFTKQQRRIIRAAARPSLAAAAAAGVSNSSAGGLVAAAAALADEVAAGVDNSFAALIHETKLRMTKQKESTQQQQGTAGALQGSAQGGSVGEQQQQQGLADAASPLLGQPADVEMAQDQQQQLLLPGEGQQRVSQQQQLGEGDEGEEEEWGYDDGEGSDGGWPGQQLQEQEDGRLAALCESESEGGEGGLVLPGPDHQEVLTQ